jgi:hypothetical protein
MISNRRFRTILLLSSASLTLSVALVRCAPLQVSQSRLQSATGPKPGSPSDPVVPIGEAGQLDSKIKSITRTQASIRELKEYEAEIKSLADSQLVTLSQETDAAAFESFKLNRTLIVGLAKDLPLDECKAYLGVTLSESALDDLGWKSDANPITTDCVPHAEGLWKISVSEKVSDKDWQLVAQSLQSLTIYVAVRPQLKIVSPGNLPGAPGAHQNGSAAVPTPPGT